MMLSIKYVYISISFSSYDTWAGEGQLQYQLSLNFATDLKAEQNMQ